MLSGRTASILASHTKPFREGAQIANCTQNASDLDASERVRMERQTRFGKL